MNVNECVLSVHSRKSVCGRCGGCEGLSELR